MHLCFIVELYRLCSPSQLKFEATSKVRRYPNHFTYMLDGISLIVYYYTYINNINNLLYYKD